MIDTANPGGGATPQLGAQVRALLSQSAKLIDYYRNECLRLEMQVAALSEQVAALRASPANADEPAVPAPETN